MQVEGKPYIEDWAKLVKLCPRYNKWIFHYNGVMMSAMASQITGASIVYSIVCSGKDQRKHQTSASLTFVRGLYRWPVNTSHKGLVTENMFPFDDVIMLKENCSISNRIEFQRNNFKQCGYGLILAVNIHNKAWTMGVLFMMQCFLSQWVSINDIDSGSDWPRVAPCHWLSNNESF